MFSPSPITLTTPSLLFPAISLILLAFTNRFLGISSVIRHLHSQYAQHPNPDLARQIDNLRRRVLLIRNMQIIGTASLVLCVICMSLVYFEFQTAAAWCFGLSLVLMLISLLISVHEMVLSVEALNILLAGIERPHPPRWRPHLPHLPKIHLHKTKHSANDEHAPPPDDVT